MLVTGEKTFKLFTISSTLGNSSILICCYDHGSKSLDKLIKIHFDPQNMKAVCLYAHNYVEKFDLLQSEGDNLIYRKFCEEECFLYAGDIVNS